MPPLPGDLQSLVTATDHAGRDRAWAAFLRGHSDVILRVARALGGGHDAMMDRYTFVVEALQRGNCQRLRAYVPEGRGSFNTWLAVVARRLCMDEYRHRYGRAQSDDADAEAARAARRQLTDLVGNELGLDAIEGGAETPDVEFDRSELRAVLDRALAQLDVADRLILRLRFEDTLSVPEIARLVGIDSPFKVYRQLDRVLMTVRKQLEAAGIHDASA